MAGALAAGQVKDLIMLEDRPLRSYTDEELGEDPLVVLSCGHVFPMSSMDGHLELGAVYGQRTISRPGNASARIWTDPYHLQVQFPTDMKA